MANRLLVSPAEELQEGERVFIQYNGIVIGVINEKGNYYAYENRCPHQGGPVCQGLIVGKVEAVLEEDRNVALEVFSDKETHLVCPWHGYEYHLDTGVCVVDKRVRLNKFEVVREGDQIYVLV